VLLCRLELEGYVHGVPIAKPRCLVSANFDQVGVGAPLQANTAHLTERMMLELKACFHFLPRRAGLDLVRVFLEGGGVSCLPLP
jgi:hypothetical protein